jgi:hypothetical protein
MVQGSSEFAKARVRDAEARYVSSERAYGALPNRTSKEQRVVTLREWNDAAAAYFSSGIDAVLSGAIQTSYSDNVSWATDLLKVVVDHCAAIRQEIETRKLRLNIDQLRPRLANLTELQRLVKDRESAVALDLRIRFIAVGLPIYGFDEPGLSESPLETRWFAFGCVLFAVAVVFAGWGFHLKDLSESQRIILTWVLPVASGFAAGCFAGSITVRARQKAPFVAVAATGGFAVWLLTSFLSFPRGSLPPTPTQDHKLEPKGGAGHSIRVRSQARWT